MQDFKDSRMGSNLGLLLNSLYWTQYGVNFIIYAARRWDRPLSVDFLLTSCCPTADFLKAICHAQLGFQNELDSDL